MPKKKALDRFSALVGDTDVTEISANPDAVNTATGRSVTTAKGPPSERRRFG